VTATSIVVSCLADDVVFALAQGQISRDGLPAIEAHLHVCPDCRSVVAETARFLHEEDGAEPLLELAGETHVPGRALSRPLSAGTRVARYVVSEVLGTGGAGVVYRAHDPQLRRDIALKLLRPEHSAAAAASERDAGRRSAALEARLLREARAMARLSHPNVVTVFDVGLFEGQVFVVMELVEGETLDAWLERPHSLEERVAKFIEAGRGLSAAHREHIAHRDFKPANVLVGSDGRVRVTDFGLARASGLDGERTATASTTEPEPMLSPLEVSREARQPGLSFATATEGALAGTPAFMAPEQFLRAGTDARTDQFSFCVALYRAAYGRAPFEGKSLEELAAAVTAGKLRPPPADSHAPPRLFAVLKRGLAVEPSLRHPSMAALLAELGAVCAPAAERAPSGGEPASLWPGARSVSPRRLLSAAAGVALLVAGLAVALAGPVRTPQRALLTSVAAPTSTGARALPAATPVQAAVAEHPHAGAVATEAAAPRTARRAVRPRAPKPRRPASASTTLTSKGERLDDRLKDPF
jgi:serine/threonine protein kinase